MKSRVKRQAERRDELVKKTIPLLRQLAKEYKIGIYGHKRSIINQIVQFEFSSEIWDAIAGELK